MLTDLAAAFVVLSSKTCGDSQSLLLSASQSSHNTRLWRTFKEFLTKRDKKNNNYLKKKSWWWISVIIILLEQPHHFHLQVIYNDPSWSILIFFWSVWSFWSIVSFNFDLSSLTFQLFCKFRRHILGYLVKQCIDLI